MSKMQRRKFVRFWANYLRENPEKGWEEYVAFMNSLPVNPRANPALLEMMKKTGKLDKPL